MGDRHQRLKLVFLFCLIFAMLTFFVLMEPFNNSLGKLIMFRYSKEPLDCIDHSIVKYMKSLSITMALTCLLFVMFSIYDYCNVSR